MNFPAADGSEETESAIIQFLSGKPLDQIELLTAKQLRRRNREERKSVSKSGKTIIAVGVEEA